MLDTMIRLKKYKNCQGQNQQGASCAQEDLLFKQCINNTFKNMFPSIIDDFTELENALKEKLAVCEDTVSTLKNKYLSMVDSYICQESQMKTENENIQQELQQLKLKEKELERKLKEAEDRLRLEKDLSRRETELESKERGTVNKEQDIQPGGEEHLTCLGLYDEKQRSVDERKGELTSKDEDSHDSESPEFGKPVRRNSNQFEPPESALLKFVRPQALPKDTSTDEGDNGRIREQSEDSDSAPLISHASNTKQRSVNERKGELTSKDEDLHDSESPEFGKPVRRNSSQSMPPEKISVES
ncbi:DNA ligase 1 [Labeo rohita]|uniref:DNA ligase 1 n=1 Tax=Labeo rohita TaxID=84645 RepID=A0A498LVK6_LABRO|nr:DNA ligase 1 [Labeo rohita]